MHAATSLSGHATSVGIDAVVWNMLEHAETLEELALDCNSISTTMCESLLAAVHGNETIQHVSLDGNSIEEQTLQELRCALELNVEFSRSHARRL